MAKFYGVVGYAEFVETAPGVHKEQIVERYYYGDLIRNSRRLQSTEHLNDDVIFSNEISIVSDPYANEHFYSIRYVVISEVKWKVSSVEVKYPRLVLTVGGLYNGK